MRINTNVASLQAQQANKDTSVNLGSSLEKLSTGLRINKAADDGSGLAIADKLRTQASSLSQSISNANSAVALTQIADKAMAEQSNILDTVKSKMIQAATSTTSTEGRAAIQRDVTKLLEQLDNIAANTNYNGTTLLDGSTFSFQIGEGSTNTVNLSVTEAANTGNLGTAADGTLTATGTQSSFGSVATSPAELSIVLANLTSTDPSVGDTVRIVAEDIASGVKEIYTYSITQTDIDTHAAGGTQVATAIANGLVAAAAAGTLGTVNQTTAGQISFTASTNGALMSLSADMGQNLAGLKNNATLTSTLAQDFADVVDGALNELNTIRSEFGSTQNQLESSVRNMQVTYTNLKAAESVIRDVDYAAESANFNKQNIIAQAGTYAMSQANAVSQNVLRLLQ